jgi:hypothetical protein
LAILAFYLYYIFLLIVQIIQGRISIHSVMLWENFNIIISWSFGVYQCVSYFAGAIYGWYQRRKKPPQKAFMMYANESARNVAGSHQD